MLGRMIRDEGAREGITNGEVWANVRRALLLQAGGREGRVCRSELPKNAFPLSVVLGLGDGVVGEQVVQAAQPLLDRDVGGTVDPHTATTAPLGDEPIHDGRDDGRRADDDQGHDNSLNSLSHVSPLLGRLVGDRRAPFPEASG